MAIAVAAVGLLVTATLILLLPSVHAATLRWPRTLTALVDLVLLSAPPIAAVFVAARISGDRMSSATGLRGFSWIDIVAGLGVGLLARALVELVAPTAGGIAGGLSADVPDLLAATAVAAAGAVLVTPLIEELFFRGLLQRALSDGLGGGGQLASGIVAVLVATLVFTAMHVLAAGIVVPVGLVTGTLAVGVGCGILTLLTGRLAGAIIGHVVFNAIGVALLLL